MKIALLLSICFICLSSIAQTIPIFESNGKEDKSNYSKLLKKWLSKFDESILFTSDCYWPKSKSYLVLGYNGNKWSLIKFTQLYNSRNKTKNNIRRVRKKEIQIKNKSVDDLINYWRTSGFLMLNNDRINTKSIQFNDSTQIEFSPSDGCNEIFRVRTKNAYREINCYLPIFMQEKIPIHEREIFINCRNMFLSIAELK